MSLNGGGEGMSPKRSGCDLDIHRGGRFNNGHEVGSLKSSVRPGRLIVRQYLHTKVESQDAE